MSSESPLDQIALEYAALQHAYMAWGRPLKCHDDALAFLKKHDIKFEKGPQETGFTPFNSHWNGVTVGILRALAGDSYERLKAAFRLLLKEEPRTDYENLYMLFFLHPVRHELWYYRQHYASGYAMRLHQELYEGTGNKRRFKRNLNSALALVAKNPDVSSTAKRAKKDCCSGILKSLLIHPTTASWWEQPGSHVAPNDKMVAISFAECATPTNFFAYWLDYAQCAINEGPIFKLRDGKSHRECFDAVKEVLSDAQRADADEDTADTETKLQNRLEEFYVVKDYNQR